MSGQAIIRGVKTSGLQRSNVRSEYSDNAIRTHARERNKLQQQHAKMERARRISFHDLSHAQKSLSRSLSNLNPTISSSNMRRYSVATVTGHHHHHHSRPVSDDINFAVAPLTPISRLETPCAGGLETGHQSSPADQTLSGEKVNRKPPQMVVTSLRRSATVDLTDSSDDDDDKKLQNETTKLNRKEYLKQLSSPKNQSMVMSVRTRIGNEFDTALRNKAFQSQRRLSRVENANCVISSLSRHFPELAVRKTSNECDAETRQATSNANSRKSNFSPESGQSNNDKLATSGVTSYEVSASEHSARGILKSKTTKSEKGATSTMKKCNSADFCSSTKKILTRFRKSSEQLYARNRSEMSCD